MYFFASEQCNVKYSDGALLRCSMEDGLSGLAHEHCRGFTVPDARFNTNFLCAADDAAARVYKSMIWNRRLLLNWAEGAAVEVILCINDISKCNWEAFVDITSDAVNARISEGLCNTYENTVGLVGALVAALSPALSMSYAASGHPIVQGGMSAGDPTLILLAHVSCNGRNSTVCDGAKGPKAANMALCKWDTPTGDCLDVCVSATTQAGCNAPCAWMYAANRCVREGTPWLVHQSYPLEAALITVATSFINNFYFWPQYMAKTVYDTIMQALQLQASTAVCSDCATQTPRAHATASAGTAVADVSLSGASNAINAGSTSLTAGSAHSSEASAYQATHLTVNMSWAQINARIHAPPNANGKPKASVSTQAQEDVRNAVLGVPHAIIINFVRDIVLPPRDVMVAMYELVRAAVYVAKPSDIGSTAFVNFGIAVRDTLDVVELFASIVSEALIEYVRFEVCDSPIIILPHSN